MTQITFAENLKKYRLARGMTQEQAAEALGVNSQTVSRWECATTLPDALTLPVLAELYGVTVDDFYKKRSVAYENYAQRLAAVYEKTRDPEDFLRCALEYQKLMRSGELSVADKWNYAIIHHFMLTHCRDVAMTWYHKTLADNPDTDPNSYWRAASCRKKLFFDLGRGEEFLAEQTKRVERSNDPREWDILLESYITAGRYREGAAFFEKAVARFPDAWVLYIHGGEIAAAEKDYEKAFALWDRAGEIGTWFWDELYCKAACLDKMGEYEKAAALYTEIAEKLREAEYDVEAEMAMEEAKKIREKIR